MEENEVQQSAVDNEGRWYFTKENLKNTPSKKCGVSSKEELVLRQRAANFIQNMGEKLKVNQLCINTAIVFMHRTCMFRSFKKLRWDSLAVAAVFVAAKTEDQQRKVEDVVRLAYKCLHKGDLDPRSQHFLTKRCELISHERDLLNILGCGFIIYHPHVYIADFMGKIKASKDLGQMSYSMATQSLLLTTMCLQYKPTVVACFCIHLVSKLKNLKVDSCIKDKEWYHCIDESVTPELLEELTKEFSAVLEKSPYWLPLKRGPEDNKDGQSSQSKNNEEIVGRVKPMDDVCKESMKENIPPMPSTSSALCDNSLKIEGKLPADFLENLYAATVVPVTQSTTLEKPKSGQRRTISLAMYREKQGKKKLEHKDLLAVTTAATVNNFPPPVTSMVSVLKPNVPDKRYMPKSEKPIMTKSEKPIMTKSEKPIMTKSEKPIMTKSEKPIMTESEKPIMTESEKPIMTESEKPIMTTQEMKVVTHEEKHLPHETLATSKEVNQRIPGNSNHIKLPADFLENPYAATVEPVTQSTTLEKPKSGQRRIISLATYREKQGKKKLEHKDLLAVTTAATVNNFPPPVTSMVSVLKPNVPDKPYMPKSEKPIMTQSEKPIITKSEKPIMTKSEKPIMTKSEKPIMTKSEKPIMTKSEKLIMTKSEKPIMTKSEKPIMTKSAKPIMTKSEKPTMTESEKPIMTESEKPIMTESEKPIMTESEKPIMTESEKPIMTTQEMKVVTHEEKHLPHETLATSKEVNQRIPAKSNHIKLPADFLENPYAATVEPVTQSTTLEKPKSGQRRTISLATYREKQGKKKLEHKDLLAVTTAATVNNFPPPVTSMVSVLKPNVPDKRYMPKSKKPIMTQSEKPIMTKSEKLIMTKSEKPIMAKSEKPIMTKSKKPIMTKSEKPIMTKSEKPIMTKSEKPIMTKSEKPIMTKSEKTIMTKSEKPIMTESEKPTMTESEKPIMTESEKPIMTESEKPIMTTQEMKVVTHQEKHLPNETLSTSKEVNQRIPGKSNHIKLPFDFLENPYAATVEPVTQSTTLEKPKSGQRRIISLATYREKQGKKKLEHKDLLAVTTAATVNNFPPPVTSMVSVLKLNVPDKRYMPKSEKPIMTKCEKPIMTKSEKPIMTKSEKPIMTKSEKPIMTKSEKPIMTESEKPITTESEKPITTESEKPIMTESEKPIMTTQEMKVVTRQEKHLPHQTLATSKEVNQRIPGKSNHKNLRSSSHLDAVPVEKITHLIPKATVSPMPQVNHQPAPKVSIVQPIVRVHPKKKVPKIAPEVIRTNDSFMLLTRVDQSQYEKQIPSDTKSGQQNALPLNASSKGNVLPSVQRTLSRHAKPEPAFLNREKDMTNTDDHSHFQRKSIINVVLPNNYNGIQHSTQGIIPKQSPSCDPMKANGSKIPEQPDKNTGSASASRKAEHASRKRDRSPSSKDHISWSSGKSAKYPKVGGVTNTSLSNPNSVHLNIVKQSDLNVICNYPAQLPYVMPPSNAQPYFQPFHPYPMAPMNPPYGCPPPYFQPFRPYPMVPLNPPYGYPPPLPPQSHLTNSAPPLPRDPYPIVPMNLPYGYPPPLPPQSHSMNSAPPLPRDPPPPLPPLPPSM